MRAGRFHVEVLSWAAVTVVAWAISAHFSVFDKVVAFSRRHEQWQVDEAITIILFLSVTAFLTSLVQSRQHLRGRRRAEKDAFLAARRDVLTGLPNRRMFTELAGTALGDIWRKGGKCSVLFLDLDGFKPVNDTHGHAAGDAVLITVAERLNQVAPAPALAARLGGDEFAVLLPDVEGEYTPLLVAHQILQALAQPIDAAGRSVTVGASIGIAIGPDNGRRAEDLIRAADSAMYAAKRSGRGTIRVYRTQVEPVPSGSLIPVLQ